MQTTSVYKPLAKNKSTKIPELINLSTNFKGLLSTNSSTSCSPTKHRKIIYTYSITDTENFTDSSVNTVTDRL